MAAVPSIGRASCVEARHVAPEAVATKGLYERHATKIQGYCMHQLGSREEAEDAVQTTFMNAFRALGRGVVPEAESAWLFKIAENVCLSRRRSSWRRGRIESPSDFDVIEEIVPGPSRQRDELIGIEDALASMPEQQRRAILLREWQGLSYREVAAELEVTQSAVETLIFRARRSLAQGLEQPDSIKPAKRKSFRRALHTLDLGTLLAAAKTLLAGSAAVKATAAAVAVTAVAGGTAVTAAPKPASSVPVKAAAAAPAARSAADASIASTPSPSVSRSSDGTEAAAARRVANPLSPLSGRKAARTAVLRSGPVRTAPAAVVPGVAPTTSVAETPVAEPVEPVQAGQSNAEPAPAPVAERPQHEDRMPEPAPAESADDGKQKTDGRAATSRDLAASAEQQPVAPAPDESKRWTGKGRHDERHVPPVVVLAALSSIAAPVPAPAAEPELEEAKGEGEDRKERWKGDVRRDPVLPPAVGHPEPTPVVGAPTPPVVDPAAVSAGPEPTSERRFGEGDQGRGEGKNRSDRSALRRGK